MKLRTLAWTLPLLVACLTACRFAAVGADEKPAKKAKAKTENVAQPAGPALVPTDMFVLPDDLEISVWATSPLLANPTNMDVDRFGRIWVCEGVRYRGKAGRRPEGDRIVVVEDSDGDGKADKSWTFVQEPKLVAPLGVAVIGNKVVVSQPPELIVYTDVDGDAKFDPKVDTREVLLTGFGGNNHDHSLHSVTVGPDGWWYFNTGNAGEHVVRDRGGKLVQSGSSYENRDKNIAGKPSDDGHVYVGGMAMRMKPDGTNLQVIGHNFRNSYEQTVTSFGDVFQNDNDDTSSARTSFLLEYGNAGFSSADGKRNWRADIRRGQTTPIGHWRQEDPGSMPVGDVYGAGAPTGIVFVEGDELGKKYRGTLLSCETALNTLLGYQPQLDGAGWKLDRTVWLTTNKERKFAGTDSTGGAKTGTGGPLHIHFRPSDIAVGTDGAVYVCDWFDARSGGHQTLDDGMTGTIYRIAPKGSKLARPTYDVSTVAGLVAMLRSPAVNVRGLAANLLVAKGAEAVGAVEGLLNDDNPYVRARGVFTLSRLGAEGVAKVEAQLRRRDEQMRVAAFRALRRLDHNVLKHAGELAGDESAAVRREVALALRDVPLKDAKDLLVRLGEQFDGKDATYLEAFGLGCSGKEAAVWTALFDKIGGRADQWDARFAGITWRLHPAQALPQLKARVFNAKLPYAERRRMMTALAFIDNEHAAGAMVDIALGLEDKGDDGELKKDAVEWVKQRHNNMWRPYDVLARLPKTAGGAGKTPEVVVVAGTGKPLPPMKEIAALAGDIARGKELFSGQRAKCIDCHKAGEAKGGIVGPELGQAGKKYSREVLLDSMINPSASIALGYEATALQLTDERVITGIVVAEGDPILVRDAKGEQVAIDPKTIASRKKMTTSIMPQVQGLGLTPQELADLASFLESMK